MIRLIACAPLVLLAACPPHPPEACARPAHQTLVFYDQSASSVADPQTKQLFETVLREALRDDLQCPGDAVRGFQVHANTRGKAGRVDVERTFAPLDTSAMSLMQKAQAKMKYGQEMQKLQADGEARLAKLMTEPVEGRLRARTDLVGTLEVISDALSRGESGATARVLYLSDMHESMPQEGRDFDQHPPSSAAEAEAWADADAARLEAMHVDRARMAGVHVRVLMGNLANKDLRGPEIRRYWERLFQHAGIRHVEF